MEEQKMQEQKLYTQEQHDIALLQQADSFLFKSLSRIESQQKWMLGVMSAGFLGLWGLIAHGFKWIV